ncbi:MAG: TonB-dependent receptor [Saprospiraceae bacterium]|nr:TonB-dependent receptor [Saprospiraceae bacterium]
MNLKSLDLVTSSLTYKQVNSRGFNDTGNTRFLQLVDGVDNQSAGLGFAVGGLFGPGDLDVQSVELIPGAASALYGPVAFNGMLSMMTKSPFEHQGLSVQTKLGVNHIGDDGGAKPLYDLGFRFAKVFGERFAIKLTGNYLDGTDWYANDYTDIDTGTPAAQRGDNNPARNALNVYGDEVTSTIEGVGRISRTGYVEEDVAKYDVYSRKMSAAVHYKLTDGLTAIYQFNYGQGRTMYTGSGRYALNGFKLIQNRLELRGKNFFIRGYSTQERSTESYNSRSLAQHLNRTWVRGLDGNVVTASQADSTWFARYAAAFTGAVQGVEGQDYSAARSFADEGRLEPGTDDFEEQKDRLINTTGLQGSGVESNSSLYHVDAQYDLSPQLKVLDVLVGGNYRYYRMDSGGTLFDDAKNPIKVGEYGVFVQASKQLFQDKLKLTVSGRYDKNESFDGNFTPRASAVFSPTSNHSFRASYQTGFRNPTVPDQYIKLNVGPIIILGGAPANTKGTNAYENSVYASSLGPFFGNFEQLLQTGTPFPDAVVQSKDNLVKSDVPRIRPEETTCYEIGYKGIFGKKLLLDVNYHYSTYTNFLVNTVVMRTDSPVTLPDGSINPDAAFDIVNGNTQLFQLYTNASDEAAAQGATLGLTYSLPKNYRAHFNTTWADFELKDANPDNIPDFNTPAWKTNLTLSNDRLTDRWGFSLAWHWQQAFDWYGTFTQLEPGQVKAYNLIDAQLSYRIPNIKTTVKIGASNLTNQKIVQAYGSPAVRGLYFVSLTFDELTH